MGTWLEREYIESAQGCACPCSSLCFTSCVLLAVTMNCGAYAVCPLCCLLRACQHVAMLCCLLPAACRFLEEGDPLDSVSGLASTLHVVQPAHVLAHEYLHEQWCPDKVGVIVDIVYIGEFCTSTPGCFANMTQY